MAVINCKVCRVMFDDKSNTGMCSYCREQEDEAFKKVKSYIWDHKDVGIDEVVEACDVSKNQIMNWVVEERLEFSAGADSGIQCRICGKPISTGRFCKNCKGDVISGFSMDKPPGESGAKVMQPARNNPGRGSRMRYTRNKW